MSLFKKKDTVTIPFPKQLTDIKDNSANFKGEGKQEPPTTPANPPEEKPVTMELDEAWKKITYAAARASEIAKALCMPYAEFEYSTCQVKLKEFLMWANEGMERNRLRANFVAEEAKKKAKEAK